MVHSHIHHQSTTRHRTSAAGLGRLLTTSATLGLITLGRGALWWTGLLLLALILFSVGWHTKAWRSIWPVTAILAALSFGHLHIIPQWTGITFAGLAAIQLVLSLAPSRL